MPLLAARNKAQKKKSHPFSHVNQLIPMRLAKGRWNPRNIIMIVDPNLQRTRQTSTPCINDADVQSLSNPQSLNQNTPENIKREQIVKQEEHPAGDTLRLKSHLSQDGKVAGPRLCRGVVYCKNDKNTRELWHALQKRSQSNDMVPLQRAC